MKSSKNSFLADHPVLSRELSERKGWVIKQPAFTKIIMNSLSLTEIREFTLENLNKLK